MYKTNRTTNIIEKSPYFFNNHIVTNIQLLIYKIDNIDYTTFKCLILAINKYCIHINHLSGTKSSLTSRKKVKNQDYLLLKTCQLLTVKGRLA